MGLEYIHGLVFDSLAAENCFFRFNFNPETKSANEIETHEDNYHGTLDQVLPDAQVTLDPTGRRRKPLWRENHPSARLQFSFCVELK